MIRSSVATALVVAALSLLAACAPSTPESSDADAALPIIEVGGVPLKMELALTRQEQATGLMHRDGIAPDRGMLFVYRSPQRLSFWMKNVDFPIDIGFFTPDGVLREIYPMYPNDTLSRKSIREDLLYALEVKRHWFRENEVKPGDRLNLEQVEAAIERRTR